MIAITCSATYLVKYKNSISKDGKTHNDTWRKKYLGLNGYLYVLNDGKQYFQWNPITEEQKVLLDKGMVSTNDDVSVCDNNIEIITENSIYYFELIKELEPQLPEIIW